MAGVQRNGVYRLDRSSVLDIEDLKKIREDEPFVKLLNYLVPGLLEKAELAEKAVERPDERTVARSGYFLSIISESCKKVITEPTPLFRK